MLNTGKWAYYFLKILTHRDIRYDEINAALMYEQDDSSVESIEENRKKRLEKLKEKG